jgi:phospholipase/carboxylesterase
MGFEVAVRDAKGSQTGTVVLLHGLGANEFDLLGLADFFPDDVQVLCPRAPRLSPWGGFSWFGIDLPPGGIRVDESEARDSLAMLGSFLGELDRPILLGGFSQGAMMAVGILLEQGRLVHGILQLSGGLLPCFQPIDFKPQPVFVSHGTQDPVVPFELGRDAAQDLSELGCAVDFRAYSMGHEISTECLSDLSKWVYSWTQDRRNS